MHPTDLRLSVGARVGPKRAATGTAPAARVIQGKPPGARGVLSQQTDVHDGRAESAEGLRRH